MKIAVPTPGVSMPARPASGPARPAAAGAAASPRPPTPGVSLMVIPHDVPLVVEESRPGTNDWWNSSATP